MTIYSAGIHDLPYKNIGIREFRNLFLWVLSLFRLGFFFMGEAGNGPLLATGMYISKYTFLSKKKFNCIIHIIL